MTVNGANGELITALARVAEVIGQTQDTRKWKRHSGVLVKDKQL